MERDFEFDFRSAAAARSGKVEGLAPFPMSQSGGASNERTA
jgi:hypothetical protein